MISMIRAYAIAGLLAEGLLVALYLASRLLKATGLLRLLPTSLLKEKEN